MLKWNYFRTIYVLLSKSRNFWFLLYINQNWKICSFFFKNGHEYKKKKLFVKYRKKLEWRYRKSVDFAIICKQFQFLCNAPFLLKK